MRTVTAIIIGAAWLAAAPAGAKDTQTIRERVMAQGYVRCGVDMTPGFSGIDGDGRTAGFDIDFCRAIAAAVLGDSEAVRTSRVSTRHKFEAVLTGDLDVAFGMTTWTFSRDTTLGLAFPAVTYYDGQGFMAWSDSGIDRPAAITKGAVCVQQGTTSEGNLADYLRDRTEVRVVPALSSEDKFNAFAERRCAVVTGDLSELAVQRARRAAMPGAWAVLPGTISREPLGPVIAAGDPEWFAIVRWSVLVPMIAEARGVSSASLDDTPATDTELRRLRGEENGFGTELGLKPDWARKIIESVGSYGEIFARNLSPLGIERGENALWRHGGLIYAPPLR
ncbi:amino acid ABC transporter substrate-binding protein [Novispirillum sp. DQ9]|uniref:amino acid ABC transporter substrate-binding protein n=1 Tax=Novispirillum sp. DQ9 TaxID=3398612 RepID=UPI003C79B659